jgi:orotate phosphoribosyltransferase
MNMVAKALLETNSVYIKPKTSDFFTWTSGKKSPIYCDNRQLISYPEVRSQIVEYFIELIKSDFSNVDLIAGTATAGIPWAALIAQKLSLPMVYIRSKPKGHGLKSAIEGKIEVGQKTLIIEDLISTGKSSIEAYQHTLSNKLKPLAVLSIFSYGFSEADMAFKNINLAKRSLCDLDQLLSYAQSSNLLSKDDVEVVLDWKENYS